jgi:tRNA-splicing ligase RtcB
VIRPAVHGAGRLFGREEAKRRFTKAQMDEWLQQRGVTLVGADLDESPMAYRRTLPSPRAELLEHRACACPVQHLTITSWMGRLIGEN